MSYAHLTDFRASGTLVESLHPSQVKNGPVVVFNLTTHPIPYNNHMRSVRIYGSKSEVVVLLHGFLANKSYWSKLAPLLNGKRVVAIDLLGFGAAPKPKTSKYTYDEHINYIRSKLIALNINQPFVVAGHSTGALLAARYANNYPAEVKELILFNPPLYTSPEQAVQTLNTTNAMYRAILNSRVRFIIWPMLRKLTPIAKHTRQSRELTLQNVILKAEFIKDLDKLRQATKLIVGEHDRPIYMDNLERISLPSNVNLQIINTGHHFPRKNPKLAASFFTN